MEKNKLEKNITKKACVKSLKKSTKENVNS